MQLNWKPRLGLWCMAGLAVVAIQAKAVDMPEPEVPDTEILSTLPDGVDMPEPGTVPGQVVSCLQKGNMDINRLSTPLISCWESASNGSDSVEELHKACTQQMTPMKIDSTLVPKCPSKALGTCIGAHNGGGANSEKSLSNHYHYSPQSLQEWRKSKKNCERSGGKWYGLGNTSRFF